MKKLVFLCLLVYCFAGFSYGSVNNDLYSSFITGNPQIESISALSFGPDGILFIGDSQTARVVALRTDDNKPNAKKDGVSLEKIDVHIASMLGRKAADVVIRDMAINPISQSIYFAIEMADEGLALLKYENENFKSVDLSNISHSSISLRNAVEADAKDRRGRSLRHWSISDMQYYDGKVMLSGLSNEEFSSTLRSIPFPFSADQHYSSLEIYHAAHGQYETYSPIKTFMPYQFDGKDHVVASYTCTPLVIFPMDELKPGVHAKGKTVAELGNRNTPLDIIAYQKDGKSYLLLANSSRALMKIDPAKIAAYSDYLTSPVEESSATAGVEFLAMPYTNVLQMDKLNDDQVVLLIRKSNGDLDLDTVGTNRL